MLYDIEIPYWDTYWDSGMLHTVLGHLDLDLWSQNLNNYALTYPPHVFRHQVCVDASGCDFDL